jgi:hypothetical protein
MKKKINLLIGFSALVLLLLCAIQVYLVKTAYDYKVEQFHTEVKEKIGNITNNYTELDSSVFLKKDALYKSLLEKIIHNKSYRYNVKSDLLANEYRDILTLRLREKLNKELTESSYVIPYGTNVNAIVGKKRKIDYEVFNLKKEINENKK